MKKAITSNWLIILSIVFSVSFLSSCNQLLNKDDFQKILNQTAEDMNKKCPQTIDAETQLSNVVAMPNELRYCYKLVHYNLEDLNVDTFRHLMEPSLLNNAKTNPDLKIFRDNKTTLTWVYNDKGGRFITKISATEKDYQTTK
jgi:hypothetical protein